MLFIKAEIHASWLGNGRSLYLRYNKLPVMSTGPDFTQSRQSAVPPAFAAISGAFSRQTRQLRSRRQWFPASCSVGAGRPIRRSVRAGWRRRGGRWPCRVMGEVRPARVRGFEWHWRERGDLRFVDFQSDLLLQYSGGKFSDPGARNFRLEKSDAGTRGSYIARRGRAAPSQRSRQYRSRR